jgi:predicted transcriptional regulator
MAGELLTPQDTDNALVSCKPDYDRLTDEDRALAVDLRDKGCTQKEIAQVLKCSQQAVSKWLGKLTDTTKASKLYLAGQSLRMSINVVENGQPRDHVAVLSRNGVLEQDNSQVQFSVAVMLPGLSGAGLSPPVSVERGEGVENP